MKKSIFLFLFVFLFNAFSAQAQEGFFHGRMNPERMKKIDQLEKIKLMDILDVDEETLVRFFKRFGEFKSKTWELFSRKDSLAKEVQNVLNDSDASDKEITETLDELFEIDKQICALKSEFFLTAKEILPPQELAKFLTFEQKFRRELMRVYEKKRFQRNHMREEIE
jgi:hypothetical protein